MVRSFYFGFALSISILLCNSDVVRGQLSYKLPRSNFGGRSALAYSLNRPTVSPYLGLLSQGASQSGIPKYFTNVRPRLEQRERIRQNEMKVQRLQQDVNQARTTAIRGRGTNGLQTGHPTRFMNYLHFYPALNR